jgi:hypothetical protein
MGANPIHMEELSDFHALAGAEENFLAGSL